MFRAERVQVILQHKQHQQMLILGAEDDMSTLHAWNVQLVVACLPKIPDLGSSGYTQDSVVQLLGYSRVSCDCIVLRILCVHLFVSENLRFNVGYVPHAARDWAWILEKVKLCLERGNSVAFICKRGKHRSAVTTALFISKFLQAGFG